jgi:putative Mg2+ transporter-C (MgtC) family protein
MGDWLPSLENLGALATATLLGGALGLERELRGRWAGMRTLMLVCLGTAVFVLAMTAYPGVQSSDVSRVIQGLVTGIGFLGAGTILKRVKKDRVHGLTTAATIWVAAAVGAACGLKLYPLALSTTVLALIVLEVIRQLERGLDKAAGVKRESPKKESNDGGP